LFSDEIEDIVVNPYWNVPPSIATNEIQPHLIANPGYLDSQNMEMLSGGKVVKRLGHRLDHRQHQQLPHPAEARRRQRPRPGEVHLPQRPRHLPPRHAAKSLFARSYRAYSHGCVRVQNPLDFAGALVATNPGITEDSIKSLFGPTEKWVQLKHHNPGAPDVLHPARRPDGTIRSYGDVYGHNKKLIQLLNADNSDA